MIGGACAFVLQTYLVRWSSDRTVGWGLVGLTVLMGATYAMRDRIKEAFHRWLVGHVYRLYAQRVVRCFMPEPLAEADDRPSSGMVQRNHHLAARSAQSGEWSDAAGYFGQPRPSGHHRTPAATCQRRASATSASCSAMILLRSVSACMIRSRASPCSMRGRGGRSLSARPAAPDANSCPGHHAQGQAGNERSAHSR